MSPELFPGSVNTAMPFINFVLASNSPRRKELLDNAGLRYIADPPDVDESRLPGEAARDYAVRLALAKTLETASRHKDGLVLGADTIVVVDGEILGKPASADDAARMLRLLSGRTHEVMTGVALVDAATGRRAVACEVTRVRMRVLDERMVAAYVATGEPMDKAGGYGIQGRASLFVESVEGCYFNVVGLPMARLGRMLEELGFTLPV